MWHKEIHLPDGSPQWRVKEILQIVICPTNKLLWNIGPLVAELVLQSKQFFDLIFAEVFVLDDTRIQVIKPSKNEGMFTFHDTASLFSCSLGFVLEVFMQFSSISIFGQGL